MAETTPVVDDLPAPPSMDGPSSLDAVDESLDAAPEVIATPATPEVETPSSVKSLGTFFGLAEDQLADDNVASEAMLPYIDALVQAGSRTSYNPTPPAVQAPPAAQAPPADQVDDPFAPVVLDFDSEDFEDAPPAMVKAIKLLNEQTNRGLKAASDRAKAAEAALEAQKQQQTIQQQQVAAQQQQEVYNRAVSHLDTLNSPRYGSGPQKTVIQSIATRQVLEVASQIIRGLESFGGKVPLIENVIDAAILKVEGKAPTKSANGSPALSTPSASARPGELPLPLNAHQRAAARAAASASAPKSGSSGLGGSLMADENYLNGARAILSR